MAGLVTAARKVVGVLLVLVAVGGLFCFGGGTAICLVKFLCGDDDAALAVGRGLLYALGSLVIGVLGGLVMPKTATADAPPTPPQSQG